MASVSKVDLCMHPEVECKLIREKSDGEGRPDLAENYLRLEVQLGEEKRHCGDLLKASCALLNSGGGVLEMKISGYSDMKEAIYVAGMSGAVFAESPESYKVVQDTTVLLTFQEWKQRMTCGKHMLQLKAERGVLIKKIEMSKTRFLPKGVLLFQKDSVRAIKEYYFKISEGCPVYPEGFEANLPEEAKLVVESIQRRHASSRACIVAAPSWYTRAKGMEAYQQNICCDLLLFDRQLGGLHLFTLFKSCSTARWDKEYGYNAAKALKNALVLYGGCYEWFYIGYHMVYCCDCCSEIGSVFRTDLRNQYPHQYTCEEEEANEEKLNRILESLVSFLGAEPSLYSNEQGVCFFNLRTMEEFGSFYGAITPVDRNEWPIGSVPGTVHVRLISLCFGLDRYELVFESHVIFERYRN